MSANASSSTTTNKPTLNTTNIKPNRLPAPTLFVGPPSRNTSQLSISRIATHDSKAATSSQNPLNRHKSALSRSYYNTTTTNTTTSAADPQTSTADANDDSPTATLPPIKKASEKDVEAKWKEMQSTLNEVELTAQSSTHVFGERHAAALEELRRAQVELARAWGRGNENNNNKPAGEGGGDVRFQGAQDIASDRFRPRGRTGTSTSLTSASTALSDESSASARSGSATTGDFRAGGKTGNPTLEDETAQDIKLASERRAANEAYFKKVDTGVRDVVAKLEAVAEAMRGVEGESRSLWSNSSRSSDSTGTSTPVDNNKESKREEGGKGSG